MLWIRNWFCRGKWRMLKAIAIVLTSFIAWLILFHFLATHLLKFPSVYHVRRLTGFSHGELNKPQNVLHLPPNNESRSRIIERRRSSYLKNLAQKLKGYDNKQSLLNTVRNFYETLGIEIVRAQNERAFDEVFIHKNTTFLDDPSNPSAFIHLRYPVYEQTVPHFIDPTHREIFLKNEKYTSNLGVRNSSYHLDGHIELFRAGKVSSEFRCGQRTEISDFQGSFENAPLVNHDVMSQVTYDFVIGCPLLVPQAAAFQLFMGGVLPKIAQLTPFLAEANIRFILFDPRDSAIHEMLQQIGIPKDRIVFYRKSMELNTQYQLNSCITPPTHPILMKQTRKLLRISESLLVPMEEAYVVLLTRKGSHNSGRNIKNQDGVIQLLKQRYGEQLFIFPGPMELKKTMDIFGRTRMIIGVHGGALYNLHFAPKEAVVVEYLGMYSDGSTSSTIAHAIIWILSQNAGQTYYRVIEKPLNKKLDININIDNLIKVLDEVDKKQLPPL